jgi:hypothetical protein
VTTILKLSHLEERTEESRGMALAEVAHASAPTDEREDIQCSCGLCDENERSKI